MKRYHAADIALTEYGPEVTEDYEDLALDPVGAELDLERRGMLAPIEPAPF
jgi:hypothetical protein